MNRIVQFAVAFCAAFAVPLYAQDEPLPSTDYVLNHIRVMANQEQGNDKLFRARYAFVQVTTSRELDAKGRLKKDDTVRNRNNPHIVPASFNRSAANTDPLDDNSRSPRDTAVARKKAASAPGPAPANTEESDSKPFEKDEFALNDDLLGRFDFSVVKREVRNGRNTIVIEFKPANKKLPAHSLKDRFINKTAGRVWIDENDWMVASIDFHLTESVHVIGGLAGAVKAFNFHFDRERTPDALWYPTDVTWRLEGREFFSRKILEHEEHRSDVKKVR